MENYESLGTIGEGTYGVVLKCRHKVTGQIVAIKKFKESDDDEQVKKTALREIKVLKQLKHENIVSLLEVFRVKGKLYLVFEYVEKTILEEIEKNPEGLDPTSIKRLMWQLVRAIDFCHQHNIIHRDIKPENLLVSRNGVLKLCDFGFARPLAGPGAKYTEYVSTRWYRAPELLVGDVSYGKAVDVWSIGCMFAEITTGLPLFPGDSDIDQLYHIIKCLGHVTARQQELFRKNSLYVGVKLPQATELEPLLTRFPQLDKNSIDFLRQTIQDEPLDRWTCSELLKHPFFGNAGEQFEVELQEAIAKDLNDSAAIRKKRTRKSSRGGGHGGANLPSPTFSIKSAASYDDPIACDQQSKNTLNSTFKPMLATPSNIQTYQQQQQSTSKDKGMSYAISNSNSSSISSHSQNSSKAKGVMGTGIALIGNSNTAGTGAGGGYHLPTLHGAMSNSSSTSSTLPGVNASGGTGDTSPYGGAYIKKHGGGVPSIAENQPSYSIGAEHLDFINHHANVRQSMTSHGGRINPPMASHGALVHPFSFSGAPLMANGAPPKPPPPTTSSYMRNPYLAAQTPTTKHRVAPHGGPATVTKHGHATRLGGYANSSSLQASSDIYSPKKVNTGQVAASTTHSGTKKAHGETLTPQGIYVPPKTSHSTIRGTLNQNGDKVAKARRENDVRSF